MELELELEGLGGERRSFFFLGEISSLWLEGRAKTKLLVYQYMRGLLIQN